jgi:pantoate--beta-alanine ligase
MEILKTIAELENFLAKNTEKIAFVPTMGALHDGHLSLIDTARDYLKFSGKKGKILLSIFVNPTQFTQTLDFENYPNTVDADLQHLRKKKVDAVFLPQKKDIYVPGKFLKKSEIFLPEIFSDLEGKARKGHFEGVFQVVHRLFALIKPDCAVFGQKDFQQVFLIQFLQKKFFPEIKILTAPLFREPSGLAFSSRNARFSPEEKKRAEILFTTLKKMQEKFSAEHVLNQNISGKFLENFGKKILQSEPLVETIYYCEVRNAHTLQKISPEKFLQKGDIILLSVQFAGIHLIDNWILE